MKLSQIIIKEANEPDYTGIDDNIRQRLSSYKSHEQQWALTELRKGENIESIIDGLNYYRDKIKDNRYQQIMKPITNPINPKILTQITLQQIKTGQQQYDAKYGGISKRGAKKKAKETKREYMSTLINEPDLKIIKIEKTDDTNGAAEAAREIAKGTYWCVSHIETGDNYLKKGPLYYIEYEGNRYLCHPDSDQLRDVNDRPHEISVELYNRLVKHIGEVWRFLKDKTLPEYFNNVKNDPKLAYYYAKLYIKGRWPEAEPTIMKYPTWAYEYAAQVIKGRWPAAEPTIMKDPESASNYARDVIKGRWPEAEPYIMRSSIYSSNYAVGAIKGRWPEAESIIIQDPHSASFYACHAIKVRWPEAEPIMMQDPESAREYAMHVIKGRWPEAEPIIIQKPWTAYYYACHAIKDRWPEAEPIIMQDPYSAYVYAKDVIKGRWPAAEQTIMNKKPIQWQLSNSYLAYVYAKDVIKGRWPEAEPIIIEGPGYAIYYARDIINGRWPEAEPIIIKYPGHASYYAETVIKDRWPEAEPIIKRDNDQWNKYKEYFKIKDQA